MFTSNFIFVWFDWFNTQDDGVINFPAQYNKTLESKYKHNKGFSQSGK